jgi:IS605 OrfB family transposase
VIRTIKLSYEATPEAQALVAHWRKAQSVVIRYAYNRLLEGQKDKDILGSLRDMPQGRLDSWLTLSALKKAKSIKKANAGRKVIFGGKHYFKLRAEGKISKAEWQQRRLSPLYFEGHARSHGEQGGNHRFVLDIANNRILFYPRAKTCFELKVKLAQKSNYRELLEILEFRCTWLRDTPFTVSLTESHINICWAEKDEPLKFNLNPDRVLSLDLNPSRIGISVLEKHGTDCRVMHWTVYEYSELNKRLGKASDHPDTVHQNNKRCFELSQVAKEVQKLAVHYRCATVASEHLNIETKDHGKGKSFNKAVNNQWSRKGFILPLLRRLEAVGIKHVEVNPAYSSKLGNLFWGWKQMIPDPACAAVEIGRRFLQEDPTQWTCQNGGNQRKEERQAQAPREQSPDAQARAHWKRVWNSLNQKPGDTPRLTIRVLQDKFPELCPSQSPFQRRQSHVARYEPARVSQPPLIKLCAELRRCV